MVRNIGNYDQKIALLYLPFAKQKQLSPWKLERLFIKVLFIFLRSENDDFCKEAVAQLNDKNTAICVEIEREFLRVLEGGCTAPIGALATITNETVEFTGALFSLDGKTKLEEKASFSLNNYKNQKNEYNI